MKIKKTLSFIFVLLIFSSLALANVNWLSSAEFSPKWATGDITDNGKTSTIKNGDSVKFATGYFQSKTAPHLVDIKVTLNGQGWSKEVTAPKNVLTDKNAGLGYEEITINSADYNNKAGEYTVTIKLSDKDFGSLAKVDTSLVLKVNNLPNKNPELAVKDKQPFNTFDHTQDGKTIKVKQYKFNTNENQYVNFLITKTDADGDEVTVIPKNLPKGAKYNVYGASHFSWAPDYTQSGTYDIIFEGTDGKGGLARVDVMIVVDNANQPPTLTKVGDQSFTEGVEGSFTLEGKDAEGKAVTYTVKKTYKTEPCKWYDLSCQTADWFKDTSLPKGMVVTGNKVTWTPSNDFVQHPDTETSFNLKVSSNDGEDSSSWNYIKVTVKDVNRNPMITSFPPATATVGVKFDYTVKVSEPDGDKVIFSVLKGPKSMTVDADGKVSWTPSYDEVGNQEVEIQVTDGKYGGKTTQQFTVVVETVKPGDVMGCTNPKATNYNKDATKDDGTCKLPVDPKPVLGCTNPKATNYNKDATKDDGTCKLPPVVVEEELQVISLPNDLATEGKEYTYQPIVTSDKKVSYKLLENPEGMTIDKNTGLVKWLPTSEGKVKVVIEMTTGTKTITQSFTINVRAGYGNIQMAQVHLYPEEVSAGDYVTLYVDLKNDGDKDYENLNVRAHIYDLNLQRTSGQFDLDRGDATTKAIYLDVPYWAEAGEYTMVVSVSNSDFHSTVYRYITIK